MTLNIIEASSNTLGHQIAVDRLQWRELIDDSREFYVDSDKRDRVQVFAWSMSIKLDHVRFDNMKNGR